MSRLIRKFDEFIKGESDCFCCEDCDSKYSCEILQKAKELRFDILEHEKTHDVDHNDTCVECVNLKGNFNSLFESVEECAWRNCDCISRY